jgi:glycosyltransferase involved in cell wall biosynthesis
MLTEVVSNKLASLGGSLSVVIPVRDGALYVADAINSALSQEGVKEVLVVDDGSEDETATVVRSIADKRLRYIRQNRIGAAAARNRGVEMACCPLLAFLDADDLWLPGKIIAQLEALEGRRAEIIFTNIVEFVSPELLPGETSALIPRQGTLQGVSVVTMLLKRSDFVRVGAFNESIRTGEFLDWFGRAQELGLSSLVLPEVLVKRRLHLANHGRKYAAERNEYVKILRELLQRRRAKEK